MAAELTAALGKIAPSDVGRWSLRAVDRFLGIAERRSRNLLKVVGSVALGVVTEVGDAIPQVVTGRLGDHMGERLRAAREAVSDAAVAVRDEVTSILRLVRLLRADPATAAPIILGGALGIRAGSGGINADGGLPDLDLKVGIGAHRSPFTHSVFTGAAAEAVLAAALDLIGVIQNKLPERHDARWDSLSAMAVRSATAARRGVDAGLAFHLVADGTVQGGKAYVGLPVPMPMEAHQAVLVTNAVAELKEAASTGSAVSDWKTGPSATGAIVGLILGGPVGALVGTLVPGFVAAFANGIRRGFEDAANDVKAEGGMAAPSSVVS